MRFRARRLVHTNQVEELAPPGGSEGETGGGSPLVTIGLLTPTSAKIQVLLNSGLATLVWLTLPALLTTLVRRVALTGPRRAVRYVTLSRRRVTDATAPR